MKLKFLAVIAVIAAIPAYAQAPQKPATKADAQRVVQSISADKAKTQKYCDLAKLGEEMDQAEQKKDQKKLDALEKQAEALMAQLGPDYGKLMEGMQSINAESKEGKEIGAVMEGLDKLCAK
jgi:Skp family chaperone for outer membrane proteins